MEIYPNQDSQDYSNTRELGILLYRDYVYAFELAAILLLVAIVAAIILTLRKRPTTLYQSPERQVRVKKADRLRMVDLPPERSTNRDQGDAS